MTKERTRALKILAPLTISLMLFWIMDSRKEPETTQVSSVYSPQGNSLKPGFRGPASVPQITASKVNVHTSKGLSSPVWKEQLEKNLMLQGGGNLKSIVIEKVDSFEWKMGNVPVQVDSLVVKLEHKKGYRSSFRAIVDSSNGKILQTWDHPVNDNFDSKSKADIKIDARYHND